jgi:hypothetical protein
MPQKRREFARFRQQGWAAMLDGKAPLGAQLIRGQFRNLALIRHFSLRFCHLTVSTLARDRQKRKWFLTVDRRDLTVDRQNL